MNYSLTYEQAINGGIDGFNGIPTSPGGVSTSSPVPVVPKPTQISFNVDTWGRAIPRTWGNVKVAGALIWASKLYVPTGANFSPAVQFGSTVSDAPATGVKFAIDLCYSFGFEGLISSNRDIRKLYVNGTLVYDAEDSYLFDGIGFSLRYGREGGINAIMARDTVGGKFYYPGQTYLVFERFDIAAWGNAVPQAVEVEFYVKASIGEVNIRDDFSPNVTPLPIMERFLVFNNHLSRTMWFVDVRNDLIHKYDMDTSVFIDTRPIVGDAYYAIDTVQKETEVFNNFRPTKAYLQEMDVLITFNNSDIASPKIASLDLDTGQYKEVNLRGDNEQALVASIAKLVDDPTISKFAVSDNLHTAIIPIGTVTRSPSGNVTVVMSSIANPFGQGAATYMDGRSGKGFAAIIAYPQDGIRVGLFDGTTVKLITQIGSGVNSEKIVECLSGVMLLQFDAEGVQVITRYGADANLMWATPVPEEVDDITWFGGQLQSDMVGGFYGFTSESFTSPYYVIDISDGTIKYYGINTANNSEDICWDSTLNRFIYSGGSRNINGTNTVGYYGPEIATAKISLMQFIESLYIATGLYTNADITWDADIDELIIGAYLAQTVNLNATVESICKLYQISKVENGNTVHFFRARKTTEGLTIKLALDVSELAIESFEDDDYKAFRTVRGSTDDVPSEVVVNFIDVNANYVNNNVSWRRNSRVPTVGPTLNLTVPIVMRPVDALVLAQRVIVDGQNAIAVHSFRLSPKHAQLVRPGDVIQVTNGLYIDTVQITQHDLNGDFSASCAGLSVSTENSGAVAVPPPIAASPEDVTVTVPATGYVIDGPTIVNSDDKGDGMFTVYMGVAPTVAGNFYGAYFARRKGEGQWLSLPTIKSDTKLVVFEATGVLTDKRWTLDMDPLAVQPVSGVAPTPATFTELQLDPTLNAAFYGAPGRWELIQFMSVTGGNIVGVMRGLRGSEVHCGSHEPGDLIVLPKGPVMLEARSIADHVGTEDEYRPVSVGRTFASAVSLPLVQAEGVSARPYAPAALSYVEDEGTGDFTLSWDRRDRLGTGWGADPLPLSEVEEKYKVQILSMGDIVLRTIEVTTTSVAYTMANILADGTDFPFKFTVQQMGETGYGSTASKVIE